MENKNQPLPSNENDNEENEFEIEKVIGKRIRNGTIQYRVKWKGYDVADSTWEPIDNFNSTECIQDFEARTKLKDSGKRL